MKFRPLGRTGLELSWLSFGASSLGQEFRPVDLERGDPLGPRRARPGDELHRHLALLRPGDERVPARRRAAGRPAGLATTSGTKLGRYDPAHFDFSARRVVESVDVSLHRMGVDHLDIILCHDIEFVEMSQIVEETLPGAPQGPGAGEGPVHRRQRLPDEHLPVRPRPHRPRRDPLVQPLHAPEHDARRPGPLPEGEGGRHHERGAVLGAAADQRAAAPLAQGDPGGPRGLPARPPSTAPRRASTSPSSPCNTRSPTRTWPPASSARPTRRTSGSGSSGPTRRSTRRS